ncbi:MAG: trigger factor [Rhodospirillales bacterium]|jgi:trigger factor|nr:trigger factor [Rhodospirillales bacterium]
MQVTETNVDGLKRSYKITVPAGQIETLLVGRLAEVGKQAKVPGFRPGKIPMPILRKKYGPSVMSEVLEQAVNQGASQAVAENKLKLALRPNIEVTSFPEGGDLEFTVAVETLPEFTPMDFKAISLERLKVEAGEEEITEALDQFAQSRSTSEAITEDRATKSGDIVTIDFVGKLGDEAFQGGTAEGYELELGSNTFIPGFEDQLLGLKTGVEVKVNVTFPEAYQNDKLAGKPVVFEVKLHAIKQKVPAKLDDEMAKTMGMENLDAVKKAVKEQIERDYERLARMKLKRALLDKLSDGHDFPVPPGLLDSEFQAIWKQIEEAKAKDQLDEADKGKSDDDLKAEYQAIAARRVRLGILLAEVGRLNDIQIQQDDLNRALVAEARRFPGQEAMVFKYYREHPEAQEALKAPLLEEKVVDFILELASVSDKPATKEELMKEDDEAQAEAKPKKKASKKKAEEA